jgi:transposase
MFVRKKKNRSGSTSVVVVDKNGRQFRELKTMEVSSDAKEILALYQAGKQWISAHLGERDMFVVNEKEEEEKQVTEYLLSNIENILLNGTQLILNQVFRVVGFDVIDDKVLKQLVISRICQPMSKVATIDYLKSHFDEDIDQHRIYRYLDKLHDTQKEKIQQINVEHTQRVLGGKIGLVYYDVTTLYFETDMGNDLRKPGYSKDGKHIQPQVVLGLPVSEGSYPLAYSIHEGNKYEGHTMLPVVEDFIKRFRLNDFVIVANSGLMNNENIEPLEAKHYKYIIGARIKSESKGIKLWILSQEKTDGGFYE